MTRISVTPHRLVKHIGELGRSIEAHERAILLVCFLYDNPGFQVRQSSHHSEVKAEVAKAVKRGVEIWQVNFEPDPIGVRVSRHFELIPQFLAQGVLRP
ncbi:DNA/RNA nuclease SfsA [Streptomyces sp. NPDC050509]|uniref:DNA/RNA nuclease SfsA n=1 Tax=Streptomyces sp. NPDC050509 TaxID=3365620 RepID=UPI0037AE1E3C